MRAASGTAASRSSNGALGRALAEVAEKFENEAAAERDRYENAILTLHDKVASLRTQCELEKTRSMRQAELIEALQQQLKDSEVVETLQSKERLLEQGRLVKECEALRAEVMALRFLHSSPSSNPASENADPNGLTGGGLHVREQLLLASRAGDLERVRSLLNPDQSVVSAALGAYKKTLTEALCAASGGSGGVETVALLLTCGAAPLDGELNAVQQAARAGNDRVLDKLLTALSNSVQVQQHFVDCRNGEGMTALHLAAWGCHSKCIRLLLRHGADVTATTLTGSKTAMDIILDRNGNNSEEEKRSNDAVRQAVDALNDPATLFWSHSVRANRLYQVEEFEAARAAYNEAISLTERLPEDRVTSKANRATLYYNAARACVKVNRHLEAVARCSTAIELRGGNYANALAQRASSHMALLDYGRAVQDYQNLLSSSRGAGNDSPSGSPVPGDVEEYLRRAKELALKATDHYLVLGVNNDASAADVKKAFRKQCLRWHPDKHRGTEDDSARASIMFKAINEANEVLSDEQKRTMYDIDRISRRMDDIVRRQTDEAQQRHTAAAAASKKSRHEPANGSYFRENSSASYFDRYTKRSESAQKYDEEPFSSSDEDSRLNGEDESSEEDNFDEEEEIFADPATSYRFSSRYGRAQGSVFSEDRK